MALWCPQQGVPVVCVLGWGEMGTEPCPCSREGHPMFISSCANEGRQPPARALPPHCPPGVAVAPRARCAPGNPPWCPRGMREQNHGTAGSCGTPCSRAGRKTWKNPALSPWMHSWICSASAGQSQHTQRLNQAWPCLPCSFPHIQGQGRRNLFSKGISRPHFAWGRKNPTNPNQLLVPGNPGTAADGATSMWSRRAAGG